VRLGELVVSARRARARGRELISEPALFPLMVLLHAGFLSLPWLEVLWLKRPFVPALAAGAGAVFLGATALRIWTLRTLGGAWNVRVLVPDAVVTGGPYAWIRHPNYLVVILEIAALPLIHTAWASALALSALNGFVLWRRIRTEEAALGELEGWREAFADKKRFLPGVF
jgi:methyltransferase